MHTAVAILDSWAEVGKCTVQSWPVCNGHNRGKLISQKPPLKPREVWSIGTSLQLQAKVRDLALFNLGRRQQAYKFRPGGTESLRRVSGWQCQRAYCFYAEETGRLVQFEFIEDS